MHHKRLTIWQALTALSKENYEEYKAKYGRYPQPKEALMFYVKEKLKIDCTKPP